MKFGNVLALFFGFQLDLVTCMTVKEKYEWFQSDPKGMYGSKIKIHDLRKLQFRDKLKKVVKSTGVRRSYKKFMKTILNLHLSSHPIFVGAMLNKEKVFVMHNNVSRVTSWSFLLDGSKKAM